MLVSFLTENKREISESTDSLANDCHELIERGPRFSEFEDPQLFQSKINYKKSLNKCKLFFDSTYQTEWSHDRHFLAGHEQLGQADRNYNNVENVPLGLKVNDRTERNHFEYALGCENCRENLYFIQV